MTAISMSAQAVPSSSAAELRKAQFLGRLTGLMFIATFATSIPPVVAFYAPALSDPAFILGGGFDMNLSWGAVLEIGLIISNLATALALYPVLRHRFPGLSLGYVVARLMECGFIALGIVALLALNTLRLHVDTANPDILVPIGQALVAIHDWTFRLGPGVVVGAGNGLMLGYMMWCSRLVPRYLSILGLIGGPAILVSGIAVVIGTIDAGSVPQMIATLPEFLWELCLGIWLVVRGFNPPALAALDVRQSDRSVEGISDRRRDVPS